MALNRREFFNVVRGALFAGSMSAWQVDGLTRILDYREAKWPKMSDAELAYVLATVYHETARTMQPIKEYGDRAYFMRMYDITGQRPAKARELGNLYPGDGAKFPGMGYVQSTGRTNARKARIAVKRALGVDVDFEANPLNLMAPQYALVVLFDGMIFGTFTGKRLSNYIIPGKADFLNARRIINGTDRAALVAGYASTFLRALQRARAVQ